MSQHSLATVADNPSTGAVSKQSTTTINESVPPVETDTTTHPSQPAPPQVELPPRPRTKKTIEDILFLKPKPKPKPKHPFPGPGMPGKRPVTEGKAMQRLREAGMIILADGTLEKPREPLPIDDAEDVLGFLEPEEEAEDRAGCVNVFQRGTSHQAVEEAKDRAGCVNVFQKGKSHKAVEEARSGTLEETLSSPEPFSTSASSPNLALTLPSALSQVPVIESATNETFESDPPQMQSKKPCSVPREDV